MQRFVLSFLKRQRSLLSVQVCSRSKDSNRQAQKQERWEPLNRFCLVNICSDARSAQRQPQSQRCCIVFQIKQENPLVPTNPALALCCAIILLGSQLIWHPLHIHSNLQKVLNWITEPRSWQISSHIMLQLCICEHGIYFSPGRVSVNPFAHRLAEWTVLFCRTRLSSESAIV